MAVLPKITWPVPSSKRGSDFANQDDAMSHLEGEAGGWYLLGSNGMWHGGIHITNTTTPWCALSGKAPSEAVDFPVPYQGEQAVRCMADGEVVAYRICRDYLSLPWETGPLNVSGSFVLVRHYIQPGEQKESGLTFYTLYMHLAPWLAYPEQDGTAFKVADEQHLNAYVDKSRQWVAAELPAGTRVTWDTTVEADTMTGSNGRQYAHVTLEEPVTGSMSLKAGDRVWTVCDKGNLVPAGHRVTRPAWWSPFLPPSRETVQFDTVVCPTPYPIKAGDSIGHLGYFQIPKDGGYDACYQVHIECLSTDNNLETFLKNPEKVGENAPLYLRCPSGLSLFSKDLNTKAMVSNGRTSQGEALLTLSQMRTEQDGQGQEYWFLPYANGYVPKSNPSAETLSQYDLEKRGFTTAVDEAPSFDHLDGRTPPKGLVRQILGWLHHASSKETRITHRMVPHNYQRLLNRIDGNISPYSAQEYLSAVHNPSYRDVKNKMIVKHPSEWYHRKDDPVWLPFLNGLTRDAPEWKAYSEAHIEKMAWMQDAGTLKLGPSLWHMHPIVFLDALKSGGYDFSTREGTVRAIIEESRKQGFTLNSQLAYILATVKRETGDTFKPVREGDWVGHTSTDEYRKKHYRYYPYYGRGYVQITWDYNYRAYSEKLGVDLVSAPDKALEPNNSLFILVDGFKNGVFTGKKLTDYVNESSTDFYHARKCINGFDHADQIKGFAEDFLHKLDAGELK